MTVECATCCIASELIASWAKVLTVGTNTDAVATPRDKRNFIMNQKLNVKLFQVDGVNLVC